MQVVRNVPAGEAQADEPIEHVEQTKTQGVTTSAVGASREGTQHQTTTHHKKQVNPHQDKTTQKHSPDVCGNERLQFDQLAHSTDRGVAGPMPCQPLNLYRRACLGRVCVCGGVLLRVVAGG